MGPLLEGTFRLSSLAQSLSPVRKGLLANPGSSFIIKDKNSRRTLASAGNGTGQHNQQNLRSAARDLKGDIEGIANEADW